MPTDEFADLANEAAKEELSGTLPETKKDLWIRMGTILEEQGVHNRLISGQIQEAVENRIEALTGDKVHINTAHFYRVMREKKWYSRPHSGGAEIQEDPIVSTIPLGGSKTVLYNPNERLADAIDRMASTCKFLSAVARRIEDSDGNRVDISKFADDTDGFIWDLEQISEMCKNAADGKTSVPQQTQIIFRQVLLNEAGMLHIGKAFLKARLSMLDEVGKKFMSKKQAAKYRTGQNPNPLPLFVPKTREEAIFMGYYGLHCRQCMSWRVTTQTDANAVENLVCLDCDRTFEGMTISHCSGQGSCGALFFCEQIQYIKKNKKCPDCGKEIPRIPQHMDNYCKD